jgi:hypothetical protein
MMQRTTRIPVELPAAVSAAYSALIKSLWTDGRLDPQLREMIRMRSAVLANCVV